ncbi:UNVERIFIED_CONTAM: hypothetical protein K2H54_018332 [Gekko kuhli]
MEASSGAVVDLTHAVTMLVDMIRLQAHQPPPAVPTVSTAEASQTSAIPSSSKGLAGNTGHGLLAVGAPVAAAGPQGSMAVRAPTGGPGEHSATPAARGVAGPEHRQPGTAPMASEAPEPTRRGPGPLGTLCGPIAVPAEHDGPVVAWRDGRMRMVAHSLDRIPRNGGGRDIAGTGHTIE